MKRISDDELLGLFRAQFNDKVAIGNHINTFDLKCSRDVNTQKISVEVTIMGMAGTPTVDDFKNNKVEDANLITISREDKGSLDFELSMKDIYYLNSVEYVLTYISM